MYELIKDHPPVRGLYAERLAEEGVVASEEDADKLAEEALRTPWPRPTPSSRSRWRGPPPTGQHEIDRTMSREPKTTLPEDLLRSLNEQIVKVPDGFTVHRKLKPLLEKRREAAGRRAVDWAHAESLAFASLLALGVPIRLTGQDTERGTFSQRHLVLHDAESGEPLVPAAEPAQRGVAARAAQQPAVGAGLPRASSTATACRIPTRWCSGRPSSATS